MRRVASLPVHAVLRACALLLAGLPVAAAQDSCLRATPLTLRVRMADVTPATGATALLSGAAPAGLQLRDASTSAMWWNANADATAVQRIRGMDAPFIARPAALDLDGDGLHDRVYAVDLHGRLWRLDLAKDQPASRWVSGGILAELGRDDPLRRFVAAPDVAVHTAPGASPWVSIAFGSVSLEVAPRNNRFYVVHDHHPAMSWNERPDRGRLPIRDRDLLEAGTARAGIDHPGFVQSIGGAQVLATALTLDGRVSYSAAYAQLRDVSGCLLVHDAGGRSPVEVRSVHAATGESNAAIQAGLLPTSSTITIAHQAGTSGRNDCLIGGQALPGCSVDTRLRRRYWYLEGAD